MLRSVDGVLTVLRARSAEVMEAGVATERAFPYLPGQYVQMTFAGYPDRPFSITHSLRGPEQGGTVFFHIRLMAGGKVTPELGRRIRVGHRVTLHGPYGSAHFRPGHEGRMVLIGTNTGFAPIWSIAAAALREKPQRCMMLIAGGRTLDALYMGPALAQLARFPNVVTVPVCSGAQSLPAGVLPGRPTDYLPALVPSDVLYACGAEGVVQSAKEVAIASGASFFADPFTTSSMDLVRPQGVMTRAMAWVDSLQWTPDRMRVSGRAPSMTTARFVEPRVKQRFGS
jgi:3-phenylpropionate/trans-cinnamate dioxygenase ferredoxin reductase subunit